MRSLGLTLFGHRFLIFIKVKNSLKLFYCLIDVARSLVFAIITLVLLPLSLQMDLLIVGGYFGVGVSSGFVFICLSDKQVKTK